MAKLQVTDSQGATSSIELEQGQTLSVGRADHNDIVLRDPSLSRSHAEVYWGGSSWMVRDRGSSNGTFIENRRIDSPVPLDGGVRVKLGNCSLALETAGGVAPQPLVSFENRPFPSTGTVVISADEVLSGTVPAQANTQAQLETIQKRLAIIEKANLELLAHESVDVLIPKILDLVIESVRPQRAAILSRNADGELICRAIRGADAEQMSISKTIANTVIDQRVSVMTSDAQADDRFAAGASVIMQGIQAVMAVPLWNKKEVIGLIYADSRVQADLFRDEDLRLLTVLANIAAIQIENATLFEEQLEKERFEQEAKAAADIQSRLLPTKQPIIEGYAILGHNTPCYEVGGDYYDCLRLDDERYGIVLADVAGKGMGAAMLMAVVQATLHARADTGPAPGELVDKLNSAIDRSAPSNRFVTLFFMDLNPGTHHLLWVNAGHAPPPSLIRKSGEVVELGSGGTPLGVFAGFNYPTSELDLEPGDVIFAATDGVTDVMNPEGEMFGDDRLREMLAPLAGRPIDEIQQVIDDKLAAFSQNTPNPDDLTYVILRRND